MSLNPQGIIAAVVMVMYLPIFFLAVRICFRYGVRERAWLLLVIFSLIRIVGGALLVAAESIVPVVTGLYIGSYALEASGLSPLLLSTLGMLEIITEGPDRERRYHQAFRLLHIVGILALVLMMLGITNSGSSSAETELRAGVLIFAGLYICLIAVTALQWTNRYQLMKYRKQLLVAVSAALPILAIRTLYSVLSVFSSSSFNVSGSSTTDSNNPLAKFNMFTGSWQIFLVMDVIMEYAVAAIYTLAGTKLRLDQDYGLQKSDEYPLYAPQYQY
ncbi:hypothetical protein J3R82DRAFT_1162 [Butyriboletus roseoflavus]|nr:hypothetical protein J3R82DRAFT_1162 [Butyriboletus roseoflavus]